MNNKGKTIGQVAYEAYCAARGNKSYDGADLPVWADQRADLKSAWEHAATSVLVDKVREGDGNIMLVTPHEIDAEVAQGFRSVMSQIPGVNIVVVTDARVVRDVQRDAKPEITVTFDERLAVPEELEEKIQQSIREAFNYRDDLR